MYLGSKTQFLMRGAHADDTIQLEMSRPPPGILSPGSEIAIRWRIEDSMVFPA